MVMALTLSAPCLLLATPSIADPAPEPQAAATQEPYTDRLIDGGNLELLTGSTADRSTSTSGPVRSLVIEAGGSFLSPTSRIGGIEAPPMSQSQNEIGVSVRGQLQTDNFGLLGLEAQVNRDAGASSLGAAKQSGWDGSLTLFSRDLPLGSGWLADTTLGATASPTIALVRRQTRFYLPSIPLLGGSMTFKSYRPAPPQQSGTDPTPVATFNVAVGEPGLLSGFRLSDFTGLSGLAISGGGQIDLGGGWSTGTQAIAVKNSRDPYAVFAGTSSGLDTAPTADSQGALVSVGLTGSSIRLQANGIWSHRTSSLPTTGTFAANGNAEGGWVDASFRQGRVQHSGGAYIFGPGLSWGTSVLINNVYGAYYRFATSSQRWRWTLNLDAADSVDGQFASGFIANADTRRRLGFNTSLGVNSAVRLSNGQVSVQTLGYFEFENELGTSRAEIGWGHDDLSNLYRVGFNQSWSLPASFPSGSRLSTQFAYDIRRQPGNSGTLPDASFGTGTASEHANSFGAAISAGAAPFQGINFDAILSYNSNGSSSYASGYGPVDVLGGPLGPLSSDQGRAISTSLVATARLSDSLSLTLSYTDTTSTLTSRYGLAPASSQVSSSPLNTAASTRSFHLQAGYLTLRYAASAGRPRGSLGLRQYPVGGTGNIEGHVFLDANDNESREPSEQGVAGIVVILDGIQAVRTDLAGYYRFEGVADGSHRITLNVDMLPLPWIIEGVGNDGSGTPFSSTVEVGVRSTISLDIAARRG